MDDDDGAADPAAIGDPVPGPDREADDFEGGRTRREQRREDRRVQSLLRDRYDLRSRVERAERERDEALRIAAAERAGRAKGNVAQLDGDIAATKRDLREAIAEGDADRQADAQVRIAELTASRKAVEVQSEDQERQLRQAAAPPVIYAPGVREWFQRNPWYNTDAQKTDFARAIDRAALARGLKPGEAEYFAFIEKAVEQEFPGTIGKRTKAAPAVDEDDEDEDEQPVATKVVPAAAQRGGAAPVGKRPAPGAGNARQIRATEAEVRAARVSGVSLADYMAAKAEAKATA